MPRGTTKSAQAQLSLGLAARAPEPAGPELLVLPDAARVEERLLRLAEEKGLVRASWICTVAQLERELIAAARIPLALASPLALELIHRKIARERTPRGSPWFSVRGTPGFAAALRALSAALGQAMLAPAELLSLLPRLEEDAQRRLGPLARLIELAQAELAAARRCEPAAALALALASLRSDGPLPARLCAISCLRFEAVLDWPPLRLEMLFALAARLAKPLGNLPAQVKLVLPFWPERAFLAEEPLAPIFRAIEARGARSEGAAPELILEPLGDAGALGDFRARLFASAPPGAPAAAAVSLASCASPSAEAREAARRCADLLDAGVPADSIAVAARNLGDGVAEELGSAFEQLGVPWRERRGRPALAAPPVQLALSLYELLEQEFPREPLIALLTSRQLWLRGETERAGAEALARWLRAARVRDDRADGGVAAQLDRLAERVRNGARESEGAARARAQSGGDPDPAARELRELGEVRTRALRAIAELRALPAQATLRAHGTALLDLLERWELRARAQRGGEREESLSKSTISRDAAPGPLERAAAAAQARALAGIDALEAACAALAQAGREAGQAEARFSRAEWRELLARALAESTLRPPGARGAAVQLVELRELAGRSFAHLVVPGLVEGQLPAQAPIDPLLSDEDKRALNRAAARAIFRSASRSGPGETALPARQAEEPLLFQLALAAARESILLLWPRADPRGRETPRSTFADEAARALGLAAGDGEPLAKPLAGRIARIPLAAIPELAACRSEDELLARASLDAIADPAFRALAPAPREEARALVAALVRSPAREALRDVARAALAERERLGAFVGSRAPGRFSGQLSEAALDAARPLFAFGPDAPLSAQQLEQDALCPFRTFGQRVLRLREEPESEDDLSPLERGNLLHRCLEVIYRTLREQNRLPLREPRARWAPKLRALALDEMERFSRTHDVGHRGLWRLRQRELADSLEELLAAECARDARPLELERAFGGDTQDAWPPLRIPAPEGDDAVFVRGAIDRIDAIAGPHGAAGEARLVLDYKSGRLQPHSRKLRADALFAPEFQLSLYVAAVRAREPGRAVDAAYLSVREAARSQTLSAALGKNDLSLDALTELEPAARARLREQSGGAGKNLADAVWARVSRLRQGLLPVQPLDCERCGLKPVCRIAALPVDEELLK